MKSFIVGLVTVLVIGLLGFAVFKNGQIVVNRLFVSPSPSATPIALATPTPTPTPKPSATATPAPTYRPTTKGGLVKGTSTQKTTTTTTTTTNLTLTLVKSSICPISYMTEVKDIKGPLTLRYKLIDNTSFGITVWNESGEELLQNTTYGGSSGQIKTINNEDYLKVRVESKSCAGNNDNWILLTAER